MTKVQLFSYLFRCFELPDGSLPRRLCLFTGRLKLCLSQIPLCAKDSKPAAVQRLETPRLKQPLSDCTVCDGSEADATSKDSAAQSRPAGTASWRHSGKQMADSCTFAASAYFSSSDMIWKQSHSVWAFSQLSCFKICLRTNSNKGSPQNKQPRVPQRGHVQGCVHWKQLFIFGLQRKKPEERR